MAKRRAAGAQGVPEVFAYGPRHEVPPPVFAPGVAELLSCALRGPEVQRRGEDSEGNKVPVGTAGPQRSGKAIVARPERSGGARIPEGTRFPEDPQGRSVPGRQSEVL